MANKLVIMRGWRGHESVHIRPSAAALSRALKVAGTATEINPGARTVTVSTHDSMLIVLKRAWVPMVVAMAVAIGGIAVERLRDAFGSEAIFAASGSSAEPLTATHLKRVTYEVYGPIGTSGSVSYLDMDAHPQQANFSTLPWAYTITTTVPAVIANLVAQGNSDRLGCRITVNGEVKDLQNSDEHHAQTSCLVKAA